MKIIMELALLIAIIAELYLHFSMYKLSERVDNFEEWVVFLLQKRNDGTTQVVRCGECRWAKANGTYQWCGRLDSTARITADDFCSYGQKGDENVETD